MINIQKINISGYHLVSSAHSYCRNAWICALFENYIQINPFLTNKKNVNVCDEVYENARPENNGLIRAIDGIITKHYC